MLLTWTAQTHFSFLFEASTWTISSFIDKTESINGKIINNFVR